MVSVLVHLFCVLLMLLVGFWQVGSYFVGQYYQVLQQQPDLVHQFYAEDSTMIRIDGDSTDTATAMLVIFYFLFLFILVKKNLFFSFSVYWFVCLSCRLLSKLIIL